MESETADGQTNGEPKAGLASLPGPRLFVSFRDDDTNDVAVALGEQLKSDLGARSVYIYTHDNAVGQDYLARMTKSLRESDGVVTLVGQKWVGESLDGNPRIEDPEDLVRQEVEHALDASTMGLALPILVETSITELRSKFTNSDSFAFRFLQTIDENRIHVLETDRSRMFDHDSLDYHQLLVGAWYALARDPSNKILLIGDFAEADLDQFVEEMGFSPPDLAREMSRVGSNVYAFSKKALKRRIRRRSWPDVLVFVDDSSDAAAVRSLMAALDDHPMARNVGLVGLGSLGTLAATKTFAGSTFGGPSSQPATYTTASFSNSVGAISLPALAVAGVATAAAGLGISELLDVDPQSFSFDSEAVAVVAEDDRSFEGAPPGAAEVSLGDALLTEEVGPLGRWATGYELRDVTVNLPGEEPIELGQVLLPTGLSAEGMSELADEGDFQVGSAGVDAPLTYSQIPAGENFCYNLADADDVVGDFVFTREPARVRVSFNARVEDGEIAEQWTDVVMQAPAELVVFEGVEDRIENLDLGRCSSDSDWVLWSGR